VVQIDPRSARIKQPVVQDVAILALKRTQSLRNSALAELSGLPLGSHRLGPVGRGAAFGGDLAQRLGPLAGRATLVHDTAFRAFSTDC
jgi:hypothetical protein